MTTGPITKTVDDVCKWVKRQFGDESGVQITDQDIIRWLNQAQLEVARLAKPLQAISQTNIVAGQAEYSAPLENAIEVLSLEVDGIRVDGIEFQESQEFIAANDPQRTASTNIPTYWWRFANKIFFWPSPSIDISSGLRIYYTAQPAALSTTSDFLGLPDKYFQMLVDYCMSQAFELDEDFQASETARQKYNDALGSGYEEDVRGENLYYPRISLVEE